MLKRFKKCHPGSLGRENYLKTSFLANLENAIFHTSAQFSGKADGRIKGIASLGGACRDDGHAIR